MGFAGYMDIFYKRIVDMEKLPGHKEQLKGIVNEVKSTKSKTGTITHKKAVALFSNASRNKRRIISAETMTEGAHTTATVRK